MGDRYIQASVEKSRNILNSSGCLPPPEAATPAPSQHRSGPPPPHCHLHTLHLHSMRVMVLQISCESLAGDFVIAEVDFRHRIPSSPN
ncbi:hypothetical protein LSTR_LSTR002198 [Laodelphax striatellus]|uniref:Uncharacterized protein n=1 Tax=Laodelphax striatellus TaxID=195883 RepID=A0A482XQE1_LAOST|nr:hypothetical protein LSTR_LSTR017079 [Laodelphax striatellus]RZF48132.1 hypothetical protein LSTR_LSTR002198 [Laodelphax striatellus]